jgi:quinol monooxygenase YgiN
MTVEGCEGFAVYRGKDDPRRFVMVETWASVDAHQSHFERNVRASGVLAQAEALMAAPFDLAAPYYVSC